MAKIRVYELAIELGLDNKDVMAKLRQLKIPVKTHMSVLPDEDLERIRAALAEAEETGAAGGMEEKRITKGVIRRRARITAATAPLEEEPAKTDLHLLKTAVKRTRRDGVEEIAGKPEPEIVEDIPKEWGEETDEAGKPRKKPLKKKVPTPATAETGEGPAPGPGRKTSVPPGDGEEAPKMAPAEGEAAWHPASSEHAPSPTPTEPRHRRETAPATPAKSAGPAAEAKPRPAVKRKVYHRPTIRKTARAVEGEPLNIPGQTAAPRPEAPKELSAEDAKKKKKKKKGKAGEEAAPVEVFEEAPKKKLRRKIAFKVQRGMEGMEIADVEKMYHPSKKKVTSKKKVAKKTTITTPKAGKRVIKMGAGITVTELSHQLGVKSREIIKALMGEGVMAVENQVLELATAGVIASTYDYEITQEVFDEDKVLGLPAPPGDAQLRPRPPVVTVMGHVDHGKTSLLDTIRKTRVTEEEAGQITQHIGASVVETSSGKIVFIDTPGHEAFTSMRARGAKVTDIVILVVAADDGIMAQTVEAANHAKAAEVPIIVAINKIDLPAAQPKVVRQRLSEIGLTPEEWGGETIIVECSAKTGQGVPDLLEAVLLQAEILELTADPNRPGKGLVIESLLDKGKGPVVTVIVQEGTLHRGDPILCGVNYGRIRAMLDDRGNQIQDAGPSIPVELMGLSGVPEPGEILFAVDDDKKVRLVADHRLELQKATAAPQGPAKVSLEDLMARLQEGEVQNLNLILKTDTHGSSEALQQALEALSSKEVRVEFLHVGVGNITENDVLLASASNAVIMGFQIKPDANARKLADDEGVQIRTYDIIYNLIDDVKASLKGLLKPVFTEEVMGKAEVRKVFQVSKVGTVAGSYVTEGTLKRDARARLLRGGAVVYTGKIRSLRRITEDVKEVNQGLECGIALENFKDIQEGDVLEAYELTESTG